jgi:hypothetical protein
VLEEFEAFEHRDADFADIVALDHLAGAVLDRGQAARLRAGRILESSKPCQLHSDPVLGPFHNSEESSGEDNETSQV